MPDSFDNPTEAILQLAHELKDLEHRAIAVCEPIVNAIIASDSTDVGHIERTLDGLLGFDFSNRFAGIIGRSPQRRPQATSTAIVTCGTARCGTRNNRITQRLSHARFAGYSLEPLKRLNPDARKHGDFAGRRSHRGLTDGCERILVGYEVERFRCGLLGGVRPARHANVTSVLDQHVEKAKAG